MRIVKGRILYVEDHEDARDLVTLVLQERGGGIINCVRENEKKAAKADVLPYFRFSSQTES